MAEEQKSRVKPLFLVKPGAITATDIERAERECGICIIECETPDAVRLLEPPIDAGIDAQASAALSLTRMVLNHEGNSYTTFTKAGLIEWFTRALMYGSQPKAVAKVKR